MSMNLDEIIPYFKEMGFTEYEAKVYLSLLNNHPASAYSISQQSGVPHSRVYDITRRLIKKGIAVSTGTNPELFTPLSPDALMEKLERDYQRQAEELKNRLKTLPFVSDYDPVWNIHSRDEAIAQSKALVNSADKDIYLGIWDEELPLLEAELKAAEKRGVGVYILVYGSYNPEIGQVFFHGIEDFEDLDILGRTLDCVVDSKICITGSLGAKEPIQLVWTKNKGLIKSIEGYIIHDFYIAEIDKEFGGKITEVYGKNLGLLRKKFGH